jgi:hypothetical protein
MDYKNFTDKYLNNETDREKFKHMSKNDKLNIFINNFCKNMERLEKFIDGKENFVQLTKLKKFLHKLHNNILFNSNENMDEIFNSIKDILDITNTLQKEKMKYDNISSL